MLPICTQIIKKPTLVTVPLLMLPHSGMICLMMYVMLQLSPVLGKTYLFDKAFLPEYLNFLVSLWCRPCYVSGMMIIELDLVSCLRVCRGRD